MAGYFVAPTAVSLISVSVLQDNSRWVDVFQAYGRLSSTQPWADLPQTLTSVALWLLLPAGIGVIRSMRREVN